MKENYDEVLDEEINKSGYSNIIAKLRNNEIQNKT